MPSWTENAKKDVIPKECLYLLTEAYLDPNDHDNYSEAALADAKWWVELPAQKILNVCGSYEVFRDDIIQLGQKLNEAGNPVDNIVCDQQVHIDCILDAQTGMEAGEMSHNVWQWMATVF